MSYRSAVRSAFLILAARCVLTPPALAADEVKPGDAVMVVAASITNTGNHDYFRRVDLDKREFVGPLIAFSADKLIHRPLDIYDMLQKNTNELNADDGEGRPVRLVSRSLPPGDYAWVEADRSIPWGYPEYFAGHRCMGDRSAVFSIEAGRINIIRADSLWIEPMSSAQAAWRAEPAASDSVVLAEVERVRAAHPALVGEATVVQRKALISWFSKPTLPLNRWCGEPAVFNYPAIP